MVRRGLFSIAVIVAAVLSGCTFLENPTREARAVDALEESIEAIENVESYRYHVDASVTNGPKRNDATMAGVVDLDSEAMNATVNVDDEPLETYLIGQTRYQQCRQPWGG